MMDEGYIKFNCEWQAGPALAENEIKQLNSWRAKLHHMNLIGVYPGGIGFGNISQRVGTTNEFLISGTQTGGLTHLSGEHYTKVIRGDFDKNLIVCEGPIKASSESLTHLAVYEASSDINAVLHVHHHVFWKRLIGQVPATNEKIAYGTPEMAREVQRLFREEALGKRKIFVMAGHEDGVVVVGGDLNEAGTTLMKVYSQLHNSTD
ncbi:MAG: rRNA adenine methyltransferase [Candidatus Omnitrophica bacterium CG11_big_fil_rev_8_21_14_0_20_45_26]|uniref:rRNA adenine methyltransferase n=1 Tax=Candidatus Abzuiibacterium crystallinum TaxID=1974748 RepID=A0A2H0LPI8_9BACT|nr:MAG: rRNA adenine methyltransferase [Candidatus Omnitrophica bacterium CG11_big_fil_rev_8_21_14_0_20_45_26]PIW63551.1 MAG: rRNA adenine methyltransferase [Candidatus Omnitrophica bacterium CG12_big_fil_rev_8_21_14_0_65_45_16]